MTSTCILAALLFLSLPPFCNRHFSRHQVTVSKAETRNRSCSSPFPIRISDFKLQPYYFDRGKKIFERVIRALQLSAMPFIRLLKHASHVRTNHRIPFRKTGCQQPECSEAASSLLPRCGGGLTVQAGHEVTSKIRLHYNKVCWKARGRLGMVRLKSLSWPCIRAEILSWSVDNLIDVKGETCTLARVGDDPL